MAVTDAERHLVYEVLNIPDALSVLNINGDYSVGSRFENFAITSAKTQIDAIITGLDVTREARLQKLLSEWLVVATDTVKLKPNNANEGVDLNPARTRRRIHALVLVIIPVVLSTESAPGGFAVG